MGGSGQFRVQLSGAVSPFETFDDGELYFSVFNTTEVGNRYPTIIVSIAVREAVTGSLGNFLRFIKFNPHILGANINKGVYTFKHSAGPYHFHDIGHSSGLYPS